MATVKPKSKTAKAKPTASQKARSARAAAVAKRDAELAAVDRAGPELAGVPTRAEVEAVVAKLSVEDRKLFTELLVELARLLGSLAAARAWLYSRDAGFDPTPISIVQAGRVEVVREAIASQTGLSPTYA